MRKHADIDVRAYKFCGYPNEHQQAQLAKTFGCCRYLWNRMLSDHNTLYAEIGTVPNNTPADYKDLDECSWLKEVDSLALSNVQINQSNAFKAFFKGISDYPRFKKKHSSKQSYTTNCVNENIKLIGNQLTLPKVKKTITLKLHRSIKPGGILKSVTISSYFSGRVFDIFYKGSK